MLNWDDVRVFLSLARGGSVRAAAKRLGSTHATVSRRIRHLEETLGGALTERGEQGRVLSALGHRLLPLAEQMEAAAAGMDRAAFAAETGLAGPVRLSVSESLYLSVLSAPLAEFQDRFPMVELTVAVTDDLAKLHLREADVVIRITQTPPDGAVGRVLATSPLTLYAAPSYLAQRPVLDRWVALAYAPVAQPWGAARVTARTDSALTAAEMIRKGAGIGGLPCYLGDPDPHLARVPGAELRPDMTIWALTHDEVRSNPRVRALINFLYKTFASLRPLIEGQRPG